MKNQRLMLLLVPVLLAGCGAVPLKDMSSQTPVAQRAVEGDARKGAKAHTDLGMVYLREGRLDIALDEARAAISADPSFPLAYNLLGLTQMYLEQRAAAQEAFGRAMALAPNDPEINNNYGWFLCQTDRAKESLPYFTASGGNTLYPNPTKPLTNGAFCSFAAGDDKMGEDFLIKALRADSQNVDAYFLLAELYYRTDRLIDARMRIADVHRIIAPTAQSLWLALRIERKLGDHDAERGYASQIRRDFRESREYQLLKQGMYQ